MGEMRGRLLSDNVKSRWHRQKYYADKGYIKPLPVPDKKPESYNPFDFYRPSTPGNRISNNLHYLFANVDINDTGSIERFYSKYGPLGFFDREISNVVSYNPYLGHIFRLPDNSPYAGVERFSCELIPMDELMERYHIPEDKFMWPVDIPDITISSLDTWERISDFKAEVIHLKLLLDLKEAAADRDVERLGELFKNCEMDYFEDIPDNLNDKRKIAIVNHYVMSQINGELENMVTPLLDFDNSGSCISKNIAWKCDSLLTCLYMMIFLDITRGAHTRRCRHCNTYFESAKSSAYYCTLSCQEAAKSKRHKRKTGGRPL